MKFWHTKYPDVEITTDGVQEWITVAEATRVLSISEAALVQHLRGLLSDYDLNSERPYGELIINGKITLRQLYLVQERL